MRTKPTLGLFGDSYITLPQNPKFDTWAGLLAECYTIDGWGQNGSNLYHAIHTWNQTKGCFNGQPYDYAIFALTWHTRLFSVHQTRSRYMCVRQPLQWGADFQDPEIVTQEDYDEFKSTVDRYHRYVYDDDWARFRHGLEIQYIMNLPIQYPKTKFIFVPNTALSRALANQHHCKGILVDFAFEDVSNLESHAPGIMPVQDDHRAAHLTQSNHIVMYNYIKNILECYEQHSDTIQQLHLEVFDLDKVKLAAYN